MSRFLLIIASLVLMAGSGLAHAETTYYMVMFGAQTQFNAPRTSHTFATFVKAEDGLVVDEQTISWLPAEGYFGIDYSMPPLRIVPGRNYTLDETIARSPGRSVQFWGPSEITPRLYAKAMERVRYLNGGGTSYKMMILFRDNLRTNPSRNEPGGAINCIMAVSDIGGYLETGTARGVEASGQVLASLSRHLVNGNRNVQAIADQMHLRERLGW